MLLISTRSGLIWPWQNGPSYYFAGGSEGGDWELWKSDGTDVGTVRVKPGLQISPFWPFVTLNGSLLFMAYDTSHGDEIWRSDGTANGTVLLKEIQPGTVLSPINFTVCDIEYPPRRGNTLFFAADDQHSDLDHSCELWKTDATTAGTVRVSNGQLHSITEAAVVGDFVYFVGDHVLWKSNGTTLGTAPLSPTTIPNLISAQQLRPAHGRLYFAAYDSAHGQELWTSNGTPSGTALFKDICPDVCGSGPKYLTVVIQRPLSRPPPLPGPGGLVPTKNPPLHLRHPLSPPPAN
jgi:ELWxxDGT repeat protein